jgi:hypothetical protein
MQKLRGTLVEHEAIDQAQLDPKQKDDQPGQEILIAVEFHHPRALAYNSAIATAYYLTRLIEI